MENNQAFRALFALPPIQASASTSIAVPEMPAPMAVTGDRELDAVLWLRDCIKTAHPVLIEKALQAFKQIKTPAKDLEKRYCDYLVKASGGNTLAAVFGGFGFADLEAWAKTSIKKQARRIEALARFGTKEALLNLTLAEEACKRALRGLKRGKQWGEYEPAKVDARFCTKPELTPHTLSDCLYAQVYWSALYWLRNEFDIYSSDPHPAGRAHDDHCFRSMAAIAPRSKEEALTVYAYLDDSEKMDFTEAPDILRNLIAGGWA